MADAETKKLPHSELEIKVSIPWEEWRDFIGASVKKLSENMKIPGFRPGKAPKDLVERKAGKGAILSEAAEKAVQKTYSDILAKEKIEAIGPPRVEILKLEEEAEFEYKLTTAVMPEIRVDSWKNAISKVNKKYQKEKIEIPDQEIEKELEKITNSRAKLITVNRVAKKGDSVLLDFQVSINGVPIENGTGRDHPLVLGKGVFIPGFEENIEGMKEKEEKEFDLEFPEKYHDKNLAGKLASFKVKVNLVQERQIPEINDEFAKSLGKFENLASLKNSVKEGILAEKNGKQKEKRRNEFIEELIKLAEIDMPDILIREELRKMISEFEFQIQSMGMNLENYLKQVKKTEEDLKKEWAPQAEKRIKVALLLEKIAEDKEIEIPSETIEKEMNETLRYYKNVPDAQGNADLEKLYAYTKNKLQNEEVFKWLESL